MLRNKEINNNTYEAKSKTNAKRPLSQNFATPWNFFHKNKVVELTFFYYDVNYRTFSLNG